MESLILLSRLDLLRQSLEAVGKVLEWAKVQSGNLQKLQKLLLDEGSGVRAEANLVTYELQILPSVLNHPDLVRSETAADLRARLEGAIARSEKITSRLGECEKVLDTLLQFRIELGEREEKIRERFAVRVAKIRNQIETSLRRNTPTAGHTPSLDDSKSAWKLEETFREQTAPLFADYVDLLRGYTLREAGLDDGIGLLADQLLDWCDRMPTGRWRSLAIPARTTETQTPAHIIRLGFPEWTLWALPLAVFEFGRTLAKELPDLRETVTALFPPRDPPADEKQIAAAFGHALATYTVGPAYACAALLLRLDPRHLPSDPPYPDHFHAEVILETLELLERSGTAGVDFSVTRQTLRDAWSEATRQAGTEGLAGEAKEEPRRFAEAFFDWAGREIVTARYEPGMWRKAEEQRDLLVAQIDDQPPDPQPETEPARPSARPSQDIREALNVAWLGRLERPDAADPILEHIKRRWLRPSGHTPMFSPPGPQRTSRHEIADRQSVRPEPRRLP